MTLQGILLIDFLALGLILVTMNLVRTGKLYVGYALIWMVALFSVMLLVSIPPLMETVTVLVGAQFPASALTLLGLVFIFLVLLFMSVKLTGLSKQVVEIAQFIALKNGGDEQSKGQQKVDEQEVG